MGPPSRKYATVTEYQRAYSAEHKAERYADLMEATDRLFREKGFHFVTMTTVAQELGWTRSNLYRYASTIEEVFLALYREKYETFTNDLIAASSEGDTDDPDHLASLFSQVASRHRDFLDYQDILASVIETNIPHDQLVAFKRELEIRNTAGSKLVQRCCPDLALDAALEFYIALIYLACGLNGHFRCAEKQPGAMDEAGVTFGAAGFQPTLHLLAKALLEGATSA